MILLMNLAGSWNTNNADRADLHRFYVGRGCCIKWGVSYSLV